MSDLRFHHLESLHWLWLVGALVAVLLAGAAARRRDLRRFADAALLGMLLPRPGTWRHGFRAALLAGALVLLVAALLDPRWGVTYRRVQQRGIDLVFVLDVSRSMRAQDARPDRLERAKQYINDLVDALGGDRVALVTFAGVAQLACPLTVDYGAFRMALATAGPETSPRGGSLLGDGIRQAAAAFTDDVPDHKAIIVFSDGEDQDSYSLEAAQGVSGELSVPIYTVGLGDAEEGARIPVKVDGNRVYLTHDGQEVWSKMNSSLLRDIAVATGGAFIPAGIGTVDMGRVYVDRIEPVAKREFDEASVARYTPRFQWFALPALVLLLLESMAATAAAIPARRRLRQATPPAAGYGGKA